MTYVARILLSKRVFEDTLAMCVKLEKDFDDKNAPGVKLLDKLNCSFTFRITPKELCLGFRTCFSLLVIPVNIETFSLNIKFSS